MMVIRLIPHLSVTFLKAEIVAFKKVTDRCGINLITIILTYIFVIKHILLQHVIQHLQNSKQSSIKILIFDVIAHRYLTYNPFEFFKKLYGPFYGRLDWASKKIHGVGALHFPKNTPLTSSNEK